MGNSCSLVLDEGDSSRISYLNNETRVLEYTYLLGNEWVIQTVDEVLAG